MESRSVLLLLVLTASFPCSLAQQRSEHIEIELVLILMQNNYYKYGRAITAWLYKLARMQALYIIRSDISRASATRRLRTISNEIQIFACPAYNAYQCI